MLLGSIRKNLSDEKKASPEFPVAGKWDCLI
jgi:hypothetical protein